MNPNQPLISLSQAAAMTPYSAEYLGLLARKGKLRAVKLGRDWLTTKEDIRQYLETQRKKHRQMLESLQM